MSLLPEGAFSYKDHKGQLIYLLRNKPTYCEVCQGEPHEHENPFLRIQKNSDGTNIVYFYCRRDLYKRYSIAGQYITSSPEEKKDEEDKEEEDKDEEEDEEDKEEEDKEEDKEEEKEEDKEEEDEDRTLFCPPPKPILDRISDLRNKKHVPLLKKHKTTWKKNKYS